MPTTIGPDEEICPRCRKRLLIGQELRLVVAGAWTNGRLFYVPVHDACGKTRLGQALAGWKGPERLRRGQGG